MRKYVLALVVLVVLSVAATGQAQEKGQIGVTMAYPASIGFMFHPTDTLAIRPDFTFGTSSGTTNIAGAGSANSSSSTSVGGGASVVFYVRTWEHLRVYVSPRFGYTRMSSNSSSSSVTTTGSSESTGNAYAGSGTVGGQYALSRRFGVFAETGISYMRQTTSSSSTATFLPNAPVSTSSSQGHSNNWSMRAGVGAVLYF